MSNAATSVATTRARPLGRRAEQGRQLLLPGDALISPETRFEYRIERLLGKGGFGQVYLARRLGRPGAVPDVLCIKVSTHIDGWLREAYFGQLLDDHPRAIRVFDTFPVMHGGEPVLYCLALEYARHGDLSAFLRARPKRWSESHGATRDRRHPRSARQAASRPDAAPRSDPDERLRVRKPPPQARRLRHRPAAERSAWHHRQDDEYADRAERDPRRLGRRNGRRATMSTRSGSCSGCWSRAMRRRESAPPDVRTLDCSDQLKEIIHRCIGERRKRYESANELIDALATRPRSCEAGVLRSLKGVHLAFTGILSKRRSEAVKPRARAGAIVHGGPSAQTTVVVRGRPNALQAAGRDAGLKLMEIKRLREKGHRITLLNEAQFWRLVARR